MAAIETNPSTSVCALAREHNMPKTLMRELVKKDFGLKSLVKKKVQLLTPRHHDTC